MPNHDSADTYQITLINQEKALNTTIEVHSDEVILEVAELHGIQMPSSCRAGACTSCIGHLVEGGVGHHHCFLSRQEEEAGFILTCTAYPLSDCTIITHQEDVLLNVSERA